MSGANWNLRRAARLRNGGHSVADTARRQGGVGVGLLSVCGGQRRRQPGPGRQPCMHAGDPAPVHNTSRRTTAGCLSVCKPAGPPARTRARACACVCPYARIRIFADSTLSRHSCTQVLIRLSHLSRQRGVQLWLLGIAVFGLGDCLNLVALNFAAQSLLEAIGR